MEYDEDYDENYDIEERDDYDSDEEDNLGEYGTPTDEEFKEYGEFDEEDGYIESDELSRIDTGAEWRNFEEGYDKSRVGIAREIDIDEDLGTMIVDERFKKIEQMSRTPEDIFRSSVLKITQDYDLPKGIYEDSLRVMQLINKHKQKLKYKNPAAIVFALLVFETSGKISRTKLEKVYKNMANKEQMTQVDLLRYAFFIQNLRKM
jgi:hypothetical protein